ncbi:B3 DOMAIN-CONTAINING PROTEIN [Salix viminalis]|uniref:B3 DOMAIN-CONTAINING PROTEIN n=1 Tax=Salix viminalis TaxID=40686 RepID=A0A9Q0UHD4_SALVM|nr:B3 DOMAIN-CONTAINING PROTEIN [Salix viminalis]
MYIQESLHPSRDITVIAKLQEAWAVPGTVRFISGIPEIQKILVFEGAFEKIFSIIKEEGGSEGGVVVQDCLELLNNLLRNNASNQVCRFSGIASDARVPVEPLKVCTNFRAVRILAEMGEETCKECRSWEEKIYSTRFQCIQFFQFLHSGFDQRLDIPEIFARYLRKKLPDTVNLKGPSGSAWKVGLTTSNNTLFFNHGWQEFVKDHALKENDFLIFKYNGESNFDVLIFNKQSICEKAASCFVKKYESTERGNGCRTKRKTIKSSAEVVFASPKGVAGGSQPEEFIENDTDAIPGGQPNDSRVTGKKICRGIKSTEATEEDVVGGFEQVECSYNDSGTITPLRQPTSEEIETEPGQPVDTVLHARRGRKVTEQEKRNAMQLAVRAVTANGFLILMKPTHVCRRFFMVIPSAWILKRIPIKGNQDVILRFKDRAWHTRFFYHKSRDNNGGLSAGWKKFALDNKLHEFDVCVFEPLDLVNCPIILNVNIFRVVE